MQSLPQRHAPRALASLFALCVLVTSAWSQQAPVAAFTTDPSPAEGGDSLTVQFLDQSTGDITAWLWDLGDGTTSTDQNPAHTFGVGAFDVSLTVTGPAGSNKFTLLGAVDVVQTLFGFIGAPPPLSSMAVRKPSNLGDFVADEAAAVRLGKALFWDIQLGSDGLTACASCHYHAGADNRPMNTLHPGANGVFETRASGATSGPNYQLKANDFPFRKFLFPDIGEGLLSDSDDRRGTAGVHKQSFAGIDPGSSTDLGSVVADPTFQINGVNALQVTGRDSPTAIGSVFFHRLFWDGRANHKFNGVNIWGDTDPNAKVLEKADDGSLNEVSISLSDAAAASQAIGPPLSGVEMSWTGRSWPEVGQKMLARTPLAGQLVDPSDSVLGPLANLTGNGLSPSLTYAQMIQAAFHDRWWGSSELSAGFTHMEKNFSLFFGLAIMLYESTLIPDQTPYDEFASGNEGALTLAEKRGLGIFLGKGKCVECHGTPVFAGAISEELLVHSDPDEGEGILERMPMDHALAVGGLTFSTAPQNDELLLNFNPYRRRVGLLTSNNRLLAATVLPAGARCLPPGRQTFDLVPTANMLPGVDFVGRVVIETEGNCLTRLRVIVEWNEVPPAGGYQIAVGTRRFAFQMPTASQTAVYDNGFYNIGVRPNSEDIGVGGEGAFCPLSMTRRKQNGETLGSPEEEGVPFVSKNERVAVDGAFKTPTLRNVELTGPYFHNGGQGTLEQVVEFYARGTDFSDVNKRDLDPDVGGFSLVGTDKSDLVAFLKALTDERVRRQAAPFDHPELPLKAGHLGDTTFLVNDGLGQGVPAIEILEAVGAAGGPPIRTFEDRLGPAITVVFGAQRDDGAEAHVFLDNRPAANVSLLFELDLPGATVEPEQVTFTPQTYRDPRSLSLRWPPEASSTAKSLKIRVIDGDRGFRRMRVPAAPLPGGTTVSVR